MTVTSRSYNGPARRTVIGAMTQPPRDEPGPDAMRWTPAPAEPDLPAVRSLLRRVDWWAPAVEAAGDRHLDQVTRARAAQLQDATGDPGARPATADDLRRILAVARAQANRSERSEPGPDAARWAGDDVVPPYAYQIAGRIGDLRLLADLLRPFRDDGTTRGVQSSGLTVDEQLARDVPHGFYGYAAEAKIQARALQNLLGDDHPDIRSVADLDALIQRARIRRLDIMRQQARARRAPGQPGPQGRPGAAGPAQRAIDRDERGGP